MISDHIVPLAPGLFSLETHCALQFVIVDPVRHIDSSESLKIFGVSELPRRKKRFLHKFGVSVPAVVFGLREGNDMPGAFFGADPAVQDRGSPAVGAETGGRDICRHDLSAALRACKDCDAEIITLFRVL